MRVGDQVELVVLSPGRNRRHRADRAGRGIDRDDGSRWIARIVQRVLDRLLRVPLQEGIDRRVHPQPAVANARLAVHADELVADVAEEVRLLDPLVQLARLQMQVVVADRPAVLALRDDACVQHRAQYLLAPDARCARVRKRVVAGRRLRQSREQRRLCERQLPRRLREVRLRGRLDAVRLAAVVDLVQVRSQDLPLRPLVRKLHGETGLPQLARERLLARDVEIADELLRDRRAALNNLALRHVGPERARDADGVDAAVLPVALVLDRNRRLGHPRADLSPRDLLPIASLGRN
jgi:hypothetical protein